MSHLSPLDDNGFLALGKMCWLHMHLPACRKTAIAEVVGQLMRAVLHDGSVRTIDSSLPDDERFLQLGRLIWLWAHSPLHAVWDLDSAVRFLLPAVGTGQCELLIRGDTPRAYCSWALLSRAGEVRYLDNPSCLPLTDWSEGEHLWIVDWVAPFAATDSWALRRLMLCRFPARRVSALRIYPSHRRSHVVALAGRGSRAR